MAPNTRAVERLESVENKLRSTEKDFEDARKRARRAKDDFEDVMQKRSELFNKAFSHISEQIGPIYRELTRSANYPLGGQAYVSLTKCAKTLCLSYQIPRYRGLRRAIP